LIWINSAGLASLGHFDMSIAGVKLAWLQISEPIQEPLMFLPNDVIQYIAPVRTVRVLWIDRDRSLAYTFELGLQHSQPRAVAMHALADDVLAQRARLLPDDPFAAPPVPALLPQKYRDLQAKAWDIVSSLQAQVPALYQPRERAVMVAQCAEQHGVSRPSVLRYLRRFWERGQSSAALVPDYGNSGARGKIRGARAGIKRGRPRKTDGPAGLNVDADTRATFRAAVARYAATHPDFSRRAAYRQMLLEFYAGRMQQELPSFGQFSYWLDKDGTPAAGPRGAPATVQYGTSI
jgi:hypothetical protein